MWDKLTPVTLVLAMSCVIVASSHQSKICDGASVLTCSADCRAIVFCADSSQAHACQDVGSEPYCHDPPSGDAVCSVASRCKAGPLKCAMDGIYPDPYFCSVYHSCQDGALYSEVLNCTDTAFNVWTGECDIPLTHPVCREPVPACNALAQFGSLPYNPVYYYICRRDRTVLYPELLKCEDGKYFDETVGVLGSCVDGTPTTTMPTTVSSLPTEPTTTVSTIPTETMSTDSALPTEPTSPLPPRRKIHRHL